MRISGRFFLIGLVFLLMILTPVSAKIIETRLDDGRTQFSNGTYWITWDRIGNHTAGDKFFINATTNLSPGTKFEYDFYLWTYTCHQKVCNDTGWGTGGYTTVEPGNPSQPNTVSVWIDTTGFRSGGFDFMFLMASSDNPDEYKSFSTHPLFIDYDVLITPVTQTSTHTNAPLPHFLPACALLIAIVLFLFIQTRRNDHYMNEVEK